MKILKLITNAFFGVIFSLWILFEDFFWDQMVIAAKWFEGWSIVLKIENQLRKISSPWMATLCFLAPSLILTPFNIAGGMLIKGGHYVAGALVLIAMKIVGTIIFAKLFILLKNVLFKWLWFKRSYDVFVKYKTMAINFAKATYIYKISKEAVGNIKKMVVYWVKYFKRILR